jgi:hypothetical protein
MFIIKQDLERLGMGDIWINGEENNRNISREMEASMREKRSLVFYNELKSSWENKLYIEVCTQQARRGIGWWKMGIWRLGVLGEIQNRECVLCVIKKAGATY